MRYDDNLIIPDYITLHWNVQGQGKMEKRLFERHFKPILSKLFGAAQVELLPTEEVKKGDNVYDLILPWPFELNNQEEQSVQLHRNGVDFTDLERNFGNEIMDTLAVFAGSYLNNKYRAHLTAAILLSFLDLAIVRRLRTDLTGAFEGIQQLIHCFKNLAFQTYEGSPATTGLIVYRNRRNAFEQGIADMKYAFSPFEDVVRFGHDFFENPMAYRLADGERYIYASNIKMEVSGVIQIPVNRNNDSVSRSCHANVARLLRKSGSGAFAVFVNHSSELEALCRNEKIFLWRKGSWSLFDPDIFALFLKKSLNKTSITILTWAIYALSKMRVGTIVLVTDIERATLKTRTRGHVGGNEPSAGPLMRNMKGRTIKTLKDNDELIGILASDGLTVFDKQGHLIDSGIIFDTSITPKVVVGGGRTTASSAASTLGKVIKVSEDGPIELYDDGVMLYRFG